VKRLPALGIIFLLGILSLFQICVTRDAAYGQSEFPKAVKVVAPDGFSTSIYTQPSASSQALGIAFNGIVFETVGTQGDFVEVRVPDKNTTGFLHKDHTAPWQPPKKSEISPVYIGLAALAFLIAVIVLIYLLRAKKTKELEKVAASIPAAIKRGEELFRMSDYEGAIKEFNSYISLQGGDVRNPDVYRRLTVCYQNINDIKMAAHSWEKMRLLGGLKTMEDYTLGVELMIALGREAEAAEIYEHLLEKEADEERRFDIHKKLFDTYRRIKEPDRLVHHAIRLKEFGTAETSIIPDTVHFLLTEGKTDLAIESHNKDIIMGVCQELIEEKAKTPEAARVYLKCLDYDRTDPRLHRMLADIYYQSGDYRRAVSELTILHQLDKERSDQYIEEAAKIYMEKGRVADALAEGNPLIIKKIAQAFLVRSEVNAEAVSVYEKVLEFQPRAVGINRMLSTVYLTRGELDKYMDKLRLLHELDGTNHDYLSDLAQCVIDNDLIEETIKEGNRDLNAKVLRQLIKRGATHDKAVALLEKLVKLEPNNGLIRSALVKAYQQRGESAKSFEHLLTLVRLQDDQELYAQAAKAAVEQNLLHQIINEQSPKLLAATALEITHRNITGPEAQEIVELAARQNPDEPKMQEFLRAQKPHPEPRPEPKRGPAAAAQPAPVEEQERPSPPRPAAAPPSELKRQTPAPRTVENGMQVKEAKPSEPEIRMPFAQQPPPPRPVEPPKTKPQEKRPEEPRREVEQERQKKVPEGIPPRQLEKSAPHQELVQHEPAQRFQSISLSDKGTPFSEKSITTFVSGFSSGQGLRDVPREELFLPTTGGLAYKEMEVLLTDGWGRLQVGAEVNTGRSVLIRILRRDLLEPSGMEELVGQISDLGYNLVHESILPLEEVVRGPAGSVGFIHPFFSHTLETVMKSKRPPDLKTRITLIGKLLDGMAYAHNYKGVDGKLRRTYHLHLQPAQVLVDDSMTQVQIACLGYSQIYRNLTRAKHARSQEPGMSPACMPPEFFRSRSGTIRERAADIYSLGVLLYFVATGEYPFEGPSFDDYKFQHTKIFAAPPRLIDPAVPDWLEPIILGCLEKEPDKRWDTVTEMRNAFARSYK
jgi:tetratricopeptide (TPR) repeat protein